MSRQEQYRNGVNTDRRSSIGRLGADKKKRQMSVGVMKVEEGDREYLKSL